MAPLSVFQARPSTELIAVPKGILDRESGRTRRGSAGGNKSGGRAGRAPVGEGAGHPGVTGRYRGVPAGAP